MSKVSKFFSIFVFSFFFFLPDSFAQQAESVKDSIRWKAKIEEVKLFNNQGIDFLNWDSDQLMVEQIGERYQTEIFGKLKIKVKQVFFDGKELPITDKGVIKVNFNFDQNIRTFTIRVIDKVNRTFFSQYRITATNKIDEEIKPKKIRYTGGAGFTVLSYQQTNVIPFSQWAVTVKGSVVYSLVPDKIDLGASSFFNLIPFGSTSEQGYKMQYLGINSRVGYSFIEAPSKIRASMNVGFYYNTSFSEIGFGNMMGPQIYPEASYLLDNGHSIHTYCKFSPALSEDFSITFSENREVAAGVHYSFPFKPGIRMSVGLDLSQLKLSIPTSSAVTNTYSLSTGISF